MTGNAQGISAAEHLTAAHDVSAFDSGVPDHLLRYETHLSREIDRILNRLERLQRMRKGQPLPPQVDVKIS